MFNVCLDLDANGETMACYHSLPINIIFIENYFPAIKLIIPIVVMHGAFLVMHMTRFNIFTIKASYEAVITTSFFF